MQAAPPERRERPHLPELPPHRRPRVSSPLLHLLDVHIHEVQHRQSGTMLQKQAHQPTIRPRSHAAPAPHATCDQAWPLSLRCAPATRAPGCCRAPHPAARRRPPDPPRSGCWCLHRSSTTSPPPSDPAAGGDRGGRARAQRTRRLPLRSSSPPPNNILTRCTLASSTVSCATVRASSPGASGSPKCTRSFTEIPVR